MDTLERRIAPGAFHNSGEKFEPPKCQSRNRTAILSLISAWLQDTGKDFAMLWLYGPTGSGKSFIAQTIAQFCHERGLLVASFFFSKGQAGRNSEKHFMATIAYQIVLSIPDTCHHISQAIENDPSISIGSLESQLQ